VRLPEEKREKKLLRIMLSEDGSHGVAIFFAREGKSVMARQDMSNKALSGLRDSKPGRS